MLKTESMMGSLVQPEGLSQQKIPDTNRNRMRDLPVYTAMAQQLCHYTPSFIHSIYDNSNHKMCISLLIIYKCIKKKPVYRSDECACTYESWMYEHKKNGMCMHTWMIYLCEHNKKGICICTLSFHWIIWAYKPASNPSTSTNLCSYNDN
jgi:hypothetical protein